MVTASELDISALTEISIVDRLALSREKLDCASRKNVKLLALRTCLKLCNMCDEIF